MIPAAALSRRIDHLLDEREPGLTDSIHVAFDLDRAAANHGRRAGAPRRAWPLPRNLGHEAAAMMLPLASQGTVTVTGSVTVSVTVSVWVSVTVTGCVSVTVCV